MSNLLSELKRRNVIRVVVAYAVVAWALIQIGDILFSTMELGPQPGKILLSILLLGFIPAVIFSWAFELTPEGLKKDSDVDKSASDTSGTAKKLDIVTIVAVAGIAALIGWQQLNPPSTTSVSDQSIVNGATPNGSASTELQEPVDAASFCLLPCNHREIDGGVYSRRAESVGTARRGLNGIIGVEPNFIARPDNAFLFMMKACRVNHDIFSLTYRST